MVSLSISKQQIAAIRQALLSWYAINDRSLPWRVLWRRDKDPYHIWLSEVMLQQTVIKAVLPAYARFLECFPTIQALAAANTEDVMTAAKGLGYYRRFGLMQRGAQQVVASGRWPESYAEWIELAGIGEYTAGAISSIVRGERRPAIDGNVERIFCRLLNIQKPVNDPSLQQPFRSIAAQLVDPTQPGDFNQALMELGQLICRKAKPLCEICPIQACCAAKREGTQKLAPEAKIQSKAPVATAMQLFIPVHRHRLGLVQRAPTARFLKGSWGFPLSYGLAGAAMQANEPGGKVLSGTRAIGKFRHSITHHRIAAEVWIQAIAAEESRQWQWVSPETASARLVASLDQKALQQWFKAESGVPVPQ